MRSEMVVVFAGVPPEHPTAHQLDEAPGLLLASSLLIELPCFSYQALGVMRQPGCWFQSKIEKDRMPPMFDGSQHVHTNADVWVLAFVAFCCILLFAWSLHRAFFVGPDKGH